MSVVNGEVIKGVLEFVLANGTIIQNVLHFVADFVSEQTDVDVHLAIVAYAEDLYSEIDTYLDENIVVNPLLTHLIIWDVQLAKWVTQRILGASVPTIVPVSIDDPLPNQCSPVLIANTDRPKSRGRKFLAPFVDTAATGSDWIGAALTALGLALNHYLADESISANNDLLPGVPRTDADEFLEFTSGSVNSVVGSQRRRKPGIGI